MISMISFLDAGNKKNTLEAGSIFNRETDSKKLLEIYRRLSYRFDDRTA